MSDQEKQKFQKKLKEVKQQSSYANRFLRKQKITSGRIEIWKNCYRILIQHKYFFGFGPQADRYLITKYLKKRLNTILGFIIKLLEKMECMIKTMKDGSKGKIFLSQLASH